MPPDSTSALDKVLGTAIDVLPVLSGWFYLSLSFPITVIGTSRRIRSHWILASLSVTPIYGPPRDKKGATEWAPDKYVRLIANHNWMVDLQNVLKPKWPQALLWFNRQCPTTRTATQFLCDSPNASMFACTHSNANH
jgi:hypothetical protein